MARPSRTQTLAKLDFKEPLIQAGKRETTDALLKRIKTLHQKLASLEQDAVEIKSMDPVRKPLIKDTILHHKDRGVKAYAACCLADLLRLYAPDAPYSESQLRDIFNFFLVQITTNLKLSTTSTQPLQISRNKSNILNNESQQTSSQKQSASQSQALQTNRLTDIPYYTEYYHLIESLATIKSVVLVCDVPDSDTLMEGFFTGFMEIIRPDMNKTLIRYLRDILVALIEESSSLPQGVMDCLINQFENYATRPEVLSFQLTVDVCNQVADKLKRPIYAHFSEIQSTHGRDSSQNDLQILEESHKLLLTIYKFCPDLLLNVVPLLEDNLRVSEETSLRQLSVKTLGSIFSQRPGAEDPSKRFPSAWRSWLSRRIDKNTNVRLTWIEGTKGVFTNHPEVRAELQKCLIERVEDSDDRVRAALCKVIGSLDYETALHHLDAHTLQVVGGRLADKKLSVRAEAANALTKLWNLAYSEIESNNPDATKQFAWIPEAILLNGCRGSTSLDARCQLTSVFKSAILPLPQNAEDEQAWVDRLLSVTSRLNEDALMALRKATGLVDYAKGNSPFMAFVQTCEDYNGGVIADGGQDVKARLNFIIDAIARSYFGDAEKAKRDLHEFAAANESRLFKLYKTCVDIQSNLGLIIKSKNELLRRVHQGHDGILDTITSLVEASAWNIVNQSSIPPLIRRVQKPESEASSTAAAKILGILAKDGLPMFKSHTAQLVLAMMDKKNDTLVEVALQALGGVCKIIPDVTPTERRPVEKATTIAIEGTPRQAKFAVRFLARSKEPEACDNLVNSIIKGFQKADPIQLLTHLKALTELALIRPQSVEAKSDDIMKFILDDILNAPSPSADDESGDEWVEEDTLEPLDRAKISALKFLTHRCLAFSREPTAEQILLPVLKLFNSTLENEGMVNENTREGGGARCHLRLRTSTCLLKLARVRTYDKALARHSQFDMVVGVLQDPCYMVRHLYLRKLGQVVPTQRLSPKWNITPVMLAMDPDAENVAAGRLIMQKIVAACANSPQSEKIERIEMPLARLLHFLAHHPDVRLNDPEVAEGTEDTLDEQNLKDTARFIEMYLDSVAHRDNIGLLYYIAQGLKGFRDRVGDSKPLWTLAELTEVIIKNRSEKHAWPIPVYPGKVKFPSDILHHADNPEDKQKAQRAQYLSEEMRNWAKTLGKRSINPISAQTTKKVVIDKDTSPGTTTKRKSSSTTKTKRKPKKKRRVEESDEEDEDEDEDDSGSEDDDEDEEESSANESEADEAEAVIGRGGKRGAKTKAKRAVAGKKKSKKPKSKKPDPDEEEEDEVMKDGEESDLTDLDD
ncbi:uncharacterized protein L201_001763 [Kwoniella dendrophila CBS 6074]|uniref:Sister chromatid cohesion protein PDS5 n=1 Tax=Kwoniella dendrophila CBS 6074 TaxID=1295534 RepID=A0AAX4JPS1_9TREE